MTLTNEQEQQRLNALKKKGTISAFDCMFHPSQIVKKQNEQLTITAKEPAQIVSQPKMQMPARRKRHSASKVSNE